MLYTLLHGLALLYTITSSAVFAQVAFPNSPYVPPRALDGAQPTNGRSHPNPQWSNLLGNLLYFYEAQRSGNLPPSNRVPWRNSSTTSDGQDVGLDLSGGYFDAGDYIKATFPLSAALMSICWGATDYGQGYDVTNQTAYLDDMLRWGLDWLMKAHSSENTLYVLVGNADLDDAYWGGDQNIPSFRPSYQINITHPGTDAAAGASAAFSACSILYSNKSFGGPFSSPASLQNSSYAEKLLTHAQQLYSFAVNATGGQQTYQSAVPAIAASYGSSSYTDELTLAALLLSWATNSTSLFQQAESYYHTFQLAGQNGVFNWDSKTPGLAVLFAQITRASSDIGGNLTVWQSEAERYFDNIVNMRGPAWMTKNGLLYYDGDSDFASLNPALNAAMLLTRYAQIASTPERKAAYLKFAQSQVDYALGNNPMHVPYIVGSHPNSPSNPHSAMASGGNDIANIDTSPPQEAHVLYGAVIGGPDKHDNYYDIRSDWPETEVALDYNAPVLTLAAMHAFNDSNDPFYTSLEVGAYDKVRPQGRPCDPVFPDACGQLSKGGKIAVGVAVGVVGLIVFGLVAWYIYLLWSVKSQKTTR
ncbi:putative endoglucanase [Lyophyllum shimeji]|uniref:Endoglucanase n=1 Tax=Lyophyllum shimeji TaxID=47721 RepID=A0A9P3UHX6_LYOSH|nr:putative endoglucanase [Lyophyllum shimeji]